MELASKYDPKEVEGKWYQYWLDHKLFSSKPAAIVANLRVNETCGHTTHQILCKRI